MSSSNQKVGDGSGRFMHFCKVCDEIGKVSSHTEKIDTLKEYLDKEFSTNTDIYLLFKLLLPESSNRVFHMKDKQMINIFSEVFNVDKDDMLQSYDDSGNISEVLEDYFVSNKLNTANSRYSLKQIDDLLEKLTVTTKQDEQIDLLEKFVTEKMTRYDFRYFIRLIKKDLRIGAGAQILLKALHADAPNLFKANHDLEYVVKKVTGDITPSLDQSLNTSFDIMDYINSKPAQQIKDEDDDEEMEDKGKKKKEEDSGADDSSESEAEEEEDGKKSKSKKKDKKQDKPISIKVSMRLNQPVKPMLARATKSYEDALKRCPNGFFAEIKYDGERIQIHKDGKSFKCYSRNLKPIQDWKIEAVEKYIGKAINVDKAVLDGEILLVDNKSGEPLPFGTLSKHKKNNYSDASVCVFLFDILYLEGKSLFDQPLELRRKALERAVTPIKNHVHFSDYVLVTGPQDQREALLSDRMTKAIDENLEGLVLKDVKSVYSPKSRHWLKMKKDYLKGMADSADLVVLGAYFGTGNKGGLMSVFLMGCYDESDKRWKTVCKAGNGHDDDTINELNDKLSKNMVKINKDYSSLPDWIECDRTLVPDFIVKDVKKSVVWEISGASFSDSDKHSAAGISIRFPRVTKIRDDKDVEDATTVNELMKLKKASEKKDTVSLTATGSKKMKFLDAMEEEEAEQGSSSDKKRKFKSITDSSDNEEEKEIVSKKKKTASSVPQGQSSSAMEDELEEGDIFYVEADFNTIVNKNDDKDKLLCHFVDNSGRWSTRGTMGLINQLFGASVENTYLECFKSSVDNELGAFQATPILPSNAKGFSENIFVGTLIAQKKNSKNAQGAPEIDYEALNKSLEALATYAKRKKTSVHITKFHYNVPNLNHEKFDDAIKAKLKGLTVYIYSKDRADKKKCDTDKKRMENPAPKPQKVATTKSFALGGMCAYIDASVATDDKKELEELIKQHGGTTCEKISAVKTTHIISTTQNDSTNHAQNLGLPFVTPNYIQDCIDFKRILGSDDYVPKKVSVVSSSTPSAPILSVRKITELMDIFEDVTAYVAKDLSDKKEIKRFVIAYAGAIVETLSKQVTHVIASQQSEELFDVVTQNPSAKVVSAQWIWDSIDAKELKSEIPYLL